MSRSLLHYLFPVSAIAMLAASCAHSKAAPPSTTQTDTTPATNSRRPLLTPVAPQNASADDQQGQQDLATALTGLKEVDLFFGFNDDALTDQARNKLSPVADVLAKHPTLHVTIDGNCDERGTEEYNMQLGQKRADSARKYLVDLGVKPEQISTVSYGMEKPRVEGHDEKAWQENRRDDVVPSTSNQ